MNNGEGDAYDILGKIRQRAKTLALMMSPFMLQRRLIITQ
jgi:hypothetical protein